MIKLKNVSKFYYNKGIVASGFTKISLELNLKEFVVITGESGSGKSTLLNVISGLDSYEEGEMYINGKETSHYNENDFEEYRKKYIANIFQTYNLVNSYTVYQNVELVLLLNGLTKKNIKNEIIELIKKVDLYKYRNTKVSKLSGGQKQRVAIARALAKNTPIIVADEPTGNLDSKSAASVLKTLHEISSDKLVVLVTHNFEQVKQYATRIVKMHDGKIIEDKQVSAQISENIAQIEDNTYGNITFLNKIKLGIRNAFNVFPKFILLLTIYLFVCLSLMLTYSSNKKQEYETTLTGYNSNFSNTIDKRIIIQKNDKSVFTDEDYEKITSLHNVDKIVKDDLILDLVAQLTTDEEYYYGQVTNIASFSSKIDKGNMPVNDNEIIISGSRSDYYLKNYSDDFIGKELTINLDYDNTKGTKVKVVAINYTDDTSENSILGTLFSNSYTFYVSDKVLNQIRNDSNKYYSTMTSEFNDLIRPSDNYVYENQIIPVTTVPRGKVYISEDYNFTCNKYNCKNYDFKVKIDNIYYQDELNLKVGNVYNKKNFKKLTGYDKYDEMNGAFFVNVDDYNSLFEKGYYQSSVFIKDINEIDDVVNSLKEMNLTTYHVSDLLVNPFETELPFVRIIKAVTTGILIISLFFISYFIIKLILKSRNVYYSTLRILGANKKDTKRLLDIELLVICNVAYAIIVVFVALVVNKIINIEYLFNLLGYLSLEYYLIAYLVMVTMSYIITSKYSKKLFAPSAMVSYRSEV